MNDILITIIAAVIPALLTGLLTLYVTRNSQLNKNTKKISALKKRIHTLEKELSYQKELNTELKKNKSTAKADINISDENDDIER